jgi:predicted tellurium resistance membrane protein TerC
MLILIAISCLHLLSEEGIMEILHQTEAWVALLTLTFLEIVLGVDNIIFISIVSNKLPLEKQAKARNFDTLVSDIDWFYADDRGFWRACYFAVFFSLVVEVLNMRIRKASAKVKLSKRIEREAGK